MSGSVPEGKAEDEIDFFELIRGVVRRWKLVAVLTAVLVVLALVYLRTTTFTYTVQLLVTPAQSSANDALSSRLGGLSGLASLAGIDLQGQTTVSPFQLYVEGMLSREVSQRLAGDQALMTTIFSGEWDARSGKWHPPASALRPLKDFIKRMLGIPVYPWQAPGAAHLQEYVGTAVKIEQNPKSPVVIITTQQRDPRFGIQLLAAIHHATDETLRSKALDRTTQYIDYLATKLQSVTVTEHRLAIAQALSEQEKNRMVTSASTPYAAEPFGDPVASLFPTRPRPTKVLLGSVLAGLFIGSVTALLLNIWKARTSAG